jgi:hypothetical protein
MVKSLGRKIKIYMGITTVGSVVDSQQYVLREIQDIYHDYVEFVYPQVCVRRMFHDFARNMVVQDFLASDCDVLWFLDSDITPNKYVLDIMVLNWDKWQISGATYPVFMIPPGGDITEVVFTAYEKNPETGNLAPTRVPKDGKQFIDGLATGCLFIKREVFEKMEKPYFEFKYDSETRNLVEGEDLGFIRKANTLGYKFFTDFNFVCKHEKKVDLLDVNNYAIQYANRAVLRYDSSIKDQVKNAVKAAYQTGVQEGLKKSSSTKSSIWTPS